MPTSSKRPVHGVCTRLLLKKVEEAYRRLNLMAIDLDAETLIGWGWSVSQT